MSEPAQERHIPLSLIARRLWRATVVMLCIALLIFVVITGNRYLSNRRLMALVHPPPPKAEPEAVIGFGSVIGSGSAKTDWLERWIDPEHTTALLGRPKYFAVFTQDHLPDSKVQEVLQTSTGLETIFIHRRNLPEGSLQAVATRHRARTFNFETPAIRPDDGVWLRQMTQMQELAVKLTSHAPSDNDWSWLAALPDLKKVFIDIPNATDKDVLAIANCSAIFSLSVSGDAFSDAAVSRLCDSTSLRYLTLRGSQIRLHFPGDRRLPSSLIGLELKSVSIDEQSLTAMSDIQELFIVGGDFGDAQIPWLARLPSLRHLELVDLKQITDDGLKELDQCQSSCPPVAGQRPLDKHALSDTFIMRT